MVKMRMWFTGEHLEVVEPDRLVYTEGISDEDGNLQSPEAMGMPAGHPTSTEVRVTLAQVDDQTRTALTPMLVSPAIPPERWGGTWPSTSSQLREPTDTMSTTDETLLREESLRRSRERTGVRELHRVRKIVLALPEVNERLSHGEPCFFVRKMPVVLLPRRSQR